MHRVTQRERVIHTSVYRQEVNKAKLGNNIANHMGFIFALALYDKFGLTFKQITNYYTKTVNKRVAYYIDSYWRKQPKSKEHYLSDAIIRQTFIEDEHWDIVTGEAVEG